MLVGAESELVHRHVTGLTSRIDVCIIGNILSINNNMISFASERTFALSLLARVMTCVIGNGKSKKQSLI